MRDVRFRTLPAAGPGTAPWSFAGLPEFLRQVPRLRHALVTLRVIPPRQVINEVLGSGRDDAGMGGSCEWRPFELDHAEYEELVTPLANDPEYPAVTDPALESATGYSRWFGKALSKHNPKRTRRDSR